MDLTRISGPPIADALCSNKTMLVLPERPYITEPHMLRLFGLRLGVIITACPAGKMTSTVLPAVTGMQHIQAGLACSLALPLVAFSTFCMRIGNVCRPVADLQLDLVKGEREQC